MVEAGKFVDCLKEDGSDARLAMTGCVHGVCPHRLWDV